MEAIPEDLRHLKDFPTFDSSFQDKPNFRHNLSHWALKTDKIANALTSFAEAFQHFQSSGLEHLAASNNIVKSMHELSALTSNSRESSISSLFSRLGDQMESVLNYQEVYLGQVQLLNVVPIKELAATFSNLKKIHEELQFYRTQYIKAAEELCSSRHVSNLADKTNFHTSIEECYTAQKTYRLLLSKYLTALRQANTQDMVNILRRCAEHILSQFVYHQNCSKVLSDSEQEVSNVFEQTKQWSEFYTNELVLWGRLHTSIQRHIMAEFQLEMGLARQGQEDGPLTSSWAEGKVLKPILKRLPHGSHSLPHGPSHSVREKPLHSPNMGPVPSTPEWVTINHEDCSSLDKVFRQPHPPPKQQRTHSTPVLDTQNSDPTLSTRKAVVTREILTESCRSISDPDLNSDTDKERCSVSSGEVDLEVTGRGGGEGADVIMNLAHQVRAERAGRPKPPYKARYSDNSLDRSEVKKLLEGLSLHGENANGTTGSAKWKGVLSSKSKKVKQHKDIQKVKKTGRSFHSTDEILEQSGAEKDRDGRRSSSNSPQEIRSPVPKKKNGIFKLRKKKHSTNSRSPIEEFNKESSPFGFENEQDEVVLLGGDCDEPSPQHVVSNPVPTSVDKHEANADFNLQTLVLPVNKNWVKCGYLWLRMKLPNGRYAWTHIYCVVDKDRGELMIQEQSLPEPRKLENLMLCNTRPCAPSFIDRNFCFRVITPATEHLFQTINEHQMNSWVAAMMETTEEALKHSNHSIKKDPPPSSKGHESISLPLSEVVPDAMRTILAISGNDICADCGSTIELEWASVNLGIVICIKCSGVHRGLGTHISKVKSLNLDKWDRAMVEFMLLQGNTKSNSYYENTLGEGLFPGDIKKPTANASKEERKLFIKKKYMDLAFVPEFGDERSTQL